MYKSANLIFKSTKFVKLTALIVMAGLTAQAAQAAQADESQLKTKVVTVKFDAALLESPKGVEKVYKRLKRRAKIACDGSNSVLIPFKTVRDCQTSMVDQFVVSADKSVLTQYHESMTKGTVLVAEK